VAEMTSQEGAPVAQIEVEALRLDLTATITPSGLGASKNSW